MPEQVGNGFRAIAQGLQIIPGKVAVRQGVSGASGYLIFALLLVSGGVGFAVVFCHLVRVFQIPAVHQLNICVVVNHKLEVSGGYCPGQWKWSGTAHKVIPHPFCYCFPVCCCKGKTLSVLVVQCRENLFLHLVVGMATISAAVKNFNQLFLPALPGH